MESPQMVTMGFESQDGADHVSVMIGTEQNTGKTNLSVTLTGK
jgi:hypothetical protein